MDWNAVLFVAVDHECDGFLRQAWTADDNDRICRNPGYLYTRCEYLSVTRDSREVCGIHFGRLGPLNNREQMSSRGDKEDHDEEMTLDVLPYDWKTSAMSNRAEWFASVSWIVARVNNRPLTIELKWVMCKWQRWMRWLTEGRLSGFQWHWSSRRESAVSPFVYSFVPRGRADPRVVYWPN